MIRGEIVIVDFRPHDPSAKVRPALVVQNDRDNRRLTNTIVAAITTIVRGAGEPTQLLIDSGHADWTGAGLHSPSVVNCINLFTVKRQTRSADDRPSLRGDDARNR